MVGPTRDDGCFASARGVLCTEYQPGKLFCGAKIRPINRRSAHFAVACLLTPARKAGIFLFSAERITQIL